MSALVEVETNGVPGIIGEDGHRYYFSEDNAYVIELWPVGKHITYRSYYIDDVGMHSMFWSNDFWFDYNDALQGARFDFNGMGVVF